MAQAEHALTTSRRSFLRMAPGAALAVPAIVTPTPEGALMPLFRQRIEQLKNFECVAMTATCPAEDRIIDARLEWDDTIGFYRTEDRIAAGKMTTREEAITAMAIVMDPENRSFGWSFAEELGRLVLDFLKSQPAA